MIRHVIATTLAGSVLLAGAAFAQTFPAKPVRMLIGFSAGSSTDLIGRLIAAKASEAMGQQMVVENRPGAGANIAAELVARGAPDGYTILFANSGISTSAAAYAKLAYDAQRDLVAISQLTSVPHLLVVLPSLPVKSVRDFIVLAKSKPGELNFSSAGIGNSDHLAGELFKSMAGINIVHVPYKGGPQAAQDVIAGQVAAYFSGMPVGLPLHKAGRLRGIAVTTAQRAPSIPDVPTIAESGLKGYEHSLWGMAFAPAGTPKDVVAKLHAELVRAAKSPDTVERLIVQGVQSVGSSPEQAAAYLKSEIEKWRALVKQINLKLD